MNTTKILADLEQAKNNVKIMKAIVFINDNYEKKDSFNFISISGQEVKLFGDSKQPFASFLSSNFLDVDVYTLESYLERYKTQYDIDSPNKDVIKILIRYIKFLEREYKTNSSNVDYVLRQLETLIQ